jgi:hypothetical protein
MSSTSDALGGRLPLAHRSTMSESQLLLYDRMAKSVPPNRRPGTSPTN